MSVAPGSKGSAVFARVTPRVLALGRGCVIAVANPRVTPSFLSRGMRAVFVFGDNQFLGPRPPFHMKPAVLREVGRQMLSAFNLHLLYTLRPGNSRFAFAIRTASSRLSDSDLETAASMFRDRCSAEECRRKLARCLQPDGTSE